MLVYQRVISGIWRVSVPRVQTHLKVPHGFLLRGTARELQSQLQPSLTRVNLRGHEEIIRNPTQNAGKSWIIMDY